MSLNIPAVMIHSILMGLVTMIYVSGHAGTQDKTLADVLDDLIPLESLGLVLPKDEHLKKKQLDGTIQLKIVGV